MALSDRERMILQRAFKDRHQQIMFTPSGTDDELLAYSLSQRKLLEPISIGQQHACYMLTKEGAAVVAVFI